MEKHGICCKLIVRLNTLAEGEYKNPYFYKKKKNITDKISQKPFFRSFSYLDNFFNIRNNLQ